MSEKETHPGDAAELRRRAEEMDRGEAALAPENLDGLSPEEARRTLHELRVHQIELEMQNEELRRAQAELDAARARYFDLYDLAPVGYCTVSEKGLILEANLTAAGLLGMARGALVKQRLTSFIFREDEHVYYRHHKQLFETGEPQAYDLRMVEKDGTAFWARLETAAAEDAGGETVCRVVLSDITGRKRADEALRKSQERYRSVLNASPDAIVTTDLEGRIRMVSLATLTMFGCQREEEMLGHLNSDFIVPEDRDRASSHTVLMYQGVMGPNEYRGLRPDGSTFDFEVKSEFIRDAEGLPASMVFVVRDITQRRRTEDALKRSVRQLESGLAEKTVMLKEIHHRVKNNLAVTASLLSMKADGSGSEARLALEESQQRIHSIALVHEYLYDNDRLDRINFGDYARDLAQGVYSAFGGEHKRIGLDLDLDPIELGIERAVPCALILNELLSNAFKYAFAGGRTGRILVSFRQPEPACYELAVEDDGVGLPDGALGGQNKSLGLRIVRILTDQLDGSVEQKACPATRIVLRFPAAA